MPGGLADRIFRNAAAILVAGAAGLTFAGGCISPCAGYDRFPGTRISPDALVVLNRGASMAVPAGDAVPDLDEDGTRSRYDLALSILFRLLNANGNRIDGLASPRNAKDIPRFRNLIDLEDELFLGARIAVLLYGSDIPPNPGYGPAFGGRGYRAVWDSVYARGKLPPLSPAGPSARFPWADVASRFARDAFRQTQDPFSSCRPRVAILITDGSGIEAAVRSGVLPDGIDRVYALLVGVSGREERSRLRRLFEGAGGPIDDPGGPAVRTGQAVFFESPDEVDVSDVFDDIAAPFDVGPWKAAGPVAPALRTPDSCRLFAASLVARRGRNPTPDTGSLCSHILDFDGSLPDTAKREWDAASMLAGMPPASRRIYSSKDGGRKNLVIDPSGGVDPSKAGASRIPEAAGIADTVKHRPLGGLAGSTPVLVGPPSPYYADFADPAARKAFVGRHSRRKKLLLAAANDGMLHAFDAGAWDPQGDPPGYRPGTGEEEWAYFPGFLLARGNGSPPPPGHYAGHTQGTVSVADIYAAGSPSDAGGDAGWRTYAIGGAGMEGAGYFALDVTDPSSIDYPAPKWELSKEDLPLLGRSWSTPAIGKIRVKAPGGADRNGRRERWVAVVGAGKGSPSGATTLREPVDLRGPQADPRIIRVENTGNAPDSGRITLSVARIEKREGKWVPVRYRASGTYSSKDPSAFRDVVFRNRPDRIEYPPAGTVVSWTDPGVEGRALIVLDAATGEVLQEITHPDMGEVVAPPAVVNDGEGYIERVYAGDMAGNLWRAIADPHGVLELGGKPFFSVTGDGYSREICSKAAVGGGEGPYPGLWIVFGTGDCENPMDGSRGALFAVLDNLPAGLPSRVKTETVTERNLADATGIFERIEKGVVPFPGRTAKGWFAALPGVAEKFLSAPRVFHRNLFFSTFEPEYGSCPPGGTGRVYGFGMIPGRNLGNPALLDDHPPDRPQPGWKAEPLRVFPSAGILSGPVVSTGTNGPAMLYTGSADGTVTGLRIPAPASIKSIRYWRDVSR